LDAENVVIDGKHRQGGVGISSGLENDFDLGVVDTREVACSGRLEFLGLEGKGVAVHSWVRVSGMVHHRLHLVEELTGLGLETILSVEDQLEAVKRSH
jgi:hypothetical protein